jgi:hypothetical protein
MKATRFECRYQALIHLLLVGLSSLSYLGDRVDIVWALVRNHSDSASWERLVFGYGAFLLLGSAVLETWANARGQVSIGPNGSVVVAESQHSYRNHRLLLARILLVLAIGLLLPPLGTIVLLAGETILILRLWLRDDDDAAYVPLSSRYASISWGSAFRVAVSKWALTASMIVFVWTLQDRIIEVGAACSVILWLLLNKVARNRSKSVDR